MERIGQLIQNLPSVLSTMTVGELYVLAHSLSVELTFRGLPGSGDARRAATELAGPTLEAISAELDRLA